MPLGRTRENKLHSVPRTVGPPIYVLLFTELPLSYATLEYSVDAYVTEHGSFAEGAG